MDHIITDLPFKPKEITSKPKENKVYNQRWLILLLCFFFNMVTSMQISQYSLIAHIITRYYNVSYVSVQWTALVYLLIAGSLSIFGSYIVKKLNLRNAILLALTILCVSSWIRLLSVSPERFWIVMLTQTFGTFAELMSLAAPSVLSSTWFGPEDLSLTCSILVFSCLLGVTTTSLLSQELVHTRNGISSIENGLYAMAGVSIVATTILLIAMFFFFKAQPPTPPSQAQLEKVENSTTINIIDSFKQMAMNLSYWLFLASYCISVTVLNLIVTFLNHNILAVYPDANMDIGRIMMLINVMGMIGTVGSGYILDKSKHFKAIIIALYGGGTLSVFAYTFLFDQGIVYAYVISGIFGLFIFTSMSTRYDMSAELCYPVDESVSGSVTVFFTQISAVVSVYGYQALLDSVGDRTTNLITCGCMAVGFGLLCCVRFDLKRRKVNKQHTSNS